MKKTYIAIGFAALGLALASPSFAQGPAKTPNGSMPAAPSSSTPQSGGSGTGAQISGGSPTMGMAQPQHSRRMMKKKMRHHRRMRSM